MFENQPPKLVFDSNKRMLTVSGDLGRYFSTGQTIVDSPFVNMLRDFGKEVDTVILSADQAEISNLAFSRFRKKQEGSESEYLLPKLQRIIFDPEIKSLSQVSTEQLLKYIAMGVRLEFSKALETDIMKKVQGFPGYPQDNPPLSPALAKMLLEKQRLHREQEQANYLKEKAKVSEAHQRLGGDLYVFLLYSPDLTEEVIAKITLYSDSEANARQVLATVLSDTAISNGNQDLFGRAIRADEFQVQVLSGQERYREYHARQMAPSDVLYKAEYDGKKAAANILNPKFLELLESISKRDPLHLRLVRLCNEYRAHLVDSVGLENLVQTNTEEPTLAQKKFSLVNQMLTSITDEKLSEDVRVANMLQVLTPENTKILGEHRSIGFRFLDKILQALGLKDKVGFFKSHGEKLTSDIIEVQEENMGIQSKLG